ncbi:MAG: glycosyltransferase family 2 protein [Acidobacteriota bacterium]|nr:glycosyltransferase family 2 protein [Acidobacteriota bacterium]
MGSSRISFSICVPTLNAAREWPAFSAALREQTAEPDMVLIIDSSSDDGTAELAEDDGYKVLRIARSDFRHGATRQIAVDQTRSDLLVFLTQDAVLASPHSIEHLLRAFDDPAVAAAYGRQLPRAGAGAIEAHARLFNYPDESHVSSLEDVTQRGFKTIFISNSFAAYRVNLLRAAGGFPADVNFGEDTVVAALLVLSRLKIAYVAEAPVFHSHHYSWRDEYRRYRDIGALHTLHSWMLDRFGGASGEGMRFLLSQLRFLARSAPGQIPAALLSTVCKYAGYQVGRRRELPPGAARAEYIPFEVRQPEEKTLRR